MTIAIRAILTPAGMRRNRELGALWASRVRALWFFVRPEGPVLGSSEGLTSSAAADRIRAGLFAYRGAWMVTPSPKPRYDRIVSLVLLVLLGLAVVFLIDRNPDI